MNKSDFRFSDISPECLIRYLLRHLWMIVASGLIFAMCASLYVNILYTPSYQASTTYAVRSRKTSYTSSVNVTSATETANVLTEMLHTSMAMDHIRSSDEKLKDFSGNVTATQISGSNFIIIRVTAHTPEIAFLAIRAIDGLLPTFTGYVSSNCVVQVVRNPTVSGTPINQVSSTRLARQLGLLGAVAMTALLGWFFLKEGTVQTRSGARSQLDSPVIATLYHEGRRLPRLRRQKVKVPLQVFAPTTSFGYTEQINTICTRMEQESTDHGSKIFLITGVSESEGKTTVAGNVAAALAIMGKRVALLDCDLRNPSLNAFFGGKYASNHPLNQVLSAPLERNSFMDCIRRHDRLGLFMLFPAGPDRRCAELLAGNTMDEVLRQLRAFDYVILDTPPAGYFAETESLAQKADATMLVVRRDVTSAAQINDICAMLRSCGSRFLGCILNDMTHSVTEGYGYGYRYGYGYGHKYGYGYGQSHADKSRRSKKKGD